MGRCLRYASRVTCCGLVSLLAGILAACAVGPDFKAPDALGKDTPAHWRDPQRAADAEAAAGSNAPAPASASATPVASQPTEDSDPDPRWWRTFGDPTLDRLIERAAQSNLDLREAVLRVVEARAQAQGAAAQGLPNVRATGQLRARAARHQRLSRIG